MNFRYVKYAHIHVNQLVELHLEFTHFGDQIFHKDAAAVKIRDHGLRAVPSVPFCY